MNMKRSAIAAAVVGRSATSAKSLTEKINMTRSFFAAVVAATAIVLSGAPLSAQNAYITNASSFTVSVIDTATNTVVGPPIPVGNSPWRGGYAQTAARSGVTNLGDKYCVGDCRCGQYGQHDPGRL
jgi:YVTN family beta-propeller protein